MRKAEEVLSDLRVMMEYEMIMILIKIVEC